MLLIHIRFTTECTTFIGNIYTNSTFFRRQLHLNEPFVSVGGIFAEKQEFAVLDLFATKKLLTASKQTLAGIGNILPG